MAGMRTVGAVLPALGFALLLGQLPVRKYLPFLVIGYVLFAYLNVPVIGISIIAVALAALYIQLKGGEPSMPKTDKQLTKEARRAMWRYILTFQWSWNYERMQLWVSPGVSPLSWKRLRRPVKT